MKGATVTYRSLHNLGDHQATILFVRQNGTLNITMQAGIGDPVDLSRIPLVDRDALAPGTCAMVQPE